MNLCRNQSLEKAAQQQQLIVRLEFKKRDFQLYFYRDNNTIAQRTDDVTNFGHPTVTQTNKLLNLLILRELYRRI